MPSAPRALVAHRVCRRAPHRPRLWRHRVACAERRLKAGLVAATSSTYWRSHGGKTSTFTLIFTPHWGLELEFAYVYVFNDTSVSQHDISPVVNAVYFFQRGQRRND
jgi:hypothetical protein